MANRLSVSKKKVYKIFNDFVHSFSFYSDLITMLLSFKSGSSVDSVISIIVKTVFVLMLLFDMGKVYRTKVFTKS